MHQIQEKQKETPETVRKVLREETGALQNKWLIGAGSLMLATAGVSLIVSSNDSVWSFVKEYGMHIGLVAVVLSVCALIFTSRQK